MKEKDYKQKPNETATEYLARLRQMRIDFADKVAEDINNLDNNQVPNKKELLDALRKLGSNPNKTEYSETDYKVHPKEEASYIDVHEQRQTRRDKIVTKDEIGSIAIDVNRCQDVNDFIDMM